MGLQGLFGPIPNFELRIPDSFLTISFVIAGECEAGYEANNAMGLHLECLPINKCLNQTTCHPNATCHFKGPAQFGCQCTEGYSGDGSACSRKFQLSYLTKK